jgi:hypothetical protein
VQSGKVMLIRVGERNTVLRCCLFRRLVWVSIVVLQFYGGGVRPEHFSIFSPSRQIFSSELLLPVRSGENSSFLTKGVFVHRYIWTCYCFAFLTRIFCFHLLHMCCIFAAVLLDLSAA